MAYIMAVRIHEHERACLREAFENAGSLHAKPRTLCERVDHVPSDDLTDCPTCASVITGSHGCFICASYRELVNPHGLRDPEKGGCVHEAVVAAARALIRSLPRIRSEALRLVGPEPFDHVLALCATGLILRVMYLCYVLVRVRIVIGFRGKDIRELPASNVWQLPLRQPLPARPSPALI